MKFHLISLGCSKNTSDSEHISSYLIRLGCQWTSEPVEADILFINTCGFIKDAKEQSLSVIMNSLHLKEASPKQKTVVFGCLVKRYKAEITAAIPEIDHLFTFITNDDLDKLIGKKPSKEEASGCSVLKRFFTPKHIGILKIAEGCSNRCTYCAIPAIRGDFKSRAEAEILNDAKALAKSGTTEISVVAQDITRYGTDYSKKCQLPNLVKKISRISGIKWIRLHYMHPRGLTAKLIDELYSIKKVVPYFDIPFQHFSDRMLRLMKRHASPEHILNLIKHIRANYKDAIIRTTMIVGFPGENDEDFQELIDFIEAYPIDRLGGFMYSTEEGTPAAKIIPKILKPVKQQRLDELMTLQQLLATERNGKLVGNKLDIIIDKITDNLIEGRTAGDAYEVDNTVFVKTEKASMFKQGDIINVKITQADAYDFEAELVK